MQKVHTHFFKSLEMIYIQTCGQEIEISTQGCVLMWILYCHRLWTFPAQAAMSLVVLYTGNTPVPCLGLVQVVTYLHLLLWNINDINIHKMSDFACITSNTNIIFFSWFFNKLKLNTIITLKLAFFPPMTFLYTQVTHYNLTQVIMFS
jgi:hypothetical protein